MKPNTYEENHELRQDQQRLFPQSATNPLRRIRSRCRNVEILSDQDISQEQRKAVRDILRAMLDSPQFQKSKRYPALLKYIVLRTLDKDFGALKERIIGTALFGRPVDYDTNNDPEVRIVAGEVRKRIAMYFEEHPESPVRIDLPVGGYIAEFDFNACGSEDSTGMDLTDAIALSVPEDLSVAPQHLLDNSAPRFTLRGRRSLLWCAVGCIVASLGVWRYFCSTEREFWPPVLHGNVPVLILAAPNFAESSASGDGLQSSPPLTVLEDDHRPEHQFLMINIMAVADLCNAIQEYRRACQVQSSQYTQLHDIQNRTIVLLGASGNFWTKQLLQPLRYHFADGPPDAYPLPRSTFIVDRRGVARSSQWSFNFNSAPDQVKSDYSIIARFHSDITGGEVIVAAGISRFGTEGAVDYVTSPKSTKELLALAPKNWKGMNVEAVLQTQVVQGRPGHVNVVATQFW